MFVFVCFQMVKETFTYGKKVSARDINPKILDFTISSELQLFLNKTLEARFEDETG